MRNIWTIALREYKLYFSTPIAYVVAGVILSVVGGFFYLNIVAATQQPQYVPGVEVVIGPMASVLIFSIPAITMRLISEEQRLGTIELLLTAPVRDWEVVVGKWLGALLFMATIIAFTLIYPIMLNNMVDPGIDQGPLITGYLGTILLTSAFIAIGVAVSSFFSNQVATFITSLGVTLLLWWLIGFFANFSTSRFAEVLRYLDFNGHFSATMVRGILDLKDVVFFVSITALGLIVGAVSLEMRRWR
jgi:ABC-2 type transport system permease protein